MIPWKPGPTGQPGITPVPVLTRNAAPGAFAANVLGPFTAGGVFGEFVMFSFTCTSTLGNDAVAELEVDDGLGGAFVAISRAKAGALVAVVVGVQLCAMVPTGYRYQVRRIVAGGSTVGVVAAGADTGYSFMRW